MAETFRRADGATITAALTPYDTGKRAEPRKWGHSNDLGLAAMDPIERGLAEDRFGKVDFDDNESATLATVWIEQDELGRHVLHVQQVSLDSILVEVHS